MFNDPFSRSYRCSSPKVVSVPVHFISPASNESAALKIQTTFRGFLVRKSVKKISSIRTEVCKLETIINYSEIVELIRLDAKERLRINETLMSLLFKLDSIRGVDYGVREFRKGVIKKAIALQEKVDSVVSSNNRSSVNDSEIVCKITSNQVLETSLVRDQINADGVIDATIEVGNSRSTENDYEIASDQVLETIHDQFIDSVMSVDDVIETTIKVTSNRSTESDYEIASKITSDQVPETTSSICDLVVVRDSVIDATTKLANNKTTELDSKMNEDDVINATIEVTEIDRKIIFDQVLESSSIRDQVVDTDSVMNADDENVTDATMEVGDEIVVNCNTVEKTETEGERLDDKKRSIEILEKLMDDNEKMMLIMSQMCERNELQTRMLNSLSQRVEQLEKGFVCGKPRKKMKKSQSA